MNPQKFNPTAYQFTLAEGLYFSKMDEKTFYALTGKDPKGNPRLLHEKDKEGKTRPLEERVGTKLKDPETGKDGKYWWLSASDIIRLYFMRAFMEMGFKPEQAYDHYKASILETQRGESEYTREKVRGFILTVKSGEVIKTILDDLEAHAERINPFLRGLKEQRKKENKKFTAAEEVKWRDHAIQERKMRDEIGHIFQDKFDSLNRHFKEKQKEKNDE